MWALAKTQRDVNIKAVILLHLLGVSTIGLTFAGLRALGPPVVSVSVTSAVLVPSSARSATTDSAGFLERSTLWARHLTARGDG